MEIAEVSHPSRVRGLKFFPDLNGSDGFLVAPFTGAWIEITVSTRNTRTPGPVAPFTGAWIEMMALAPTLLTPDSRTLHGCVD